MLIRLSPIDVIANFQDTSSYVKVDFKGVSISDVS